LSYRIEDFQELLKKLKAKSKQITAQNKIAQEAPTLMGQKKPYDKLQQLLKEWHGIDHKIRLIRKNFKFR